MRLGTCVLVSFLAATLPAGSRAGDEPHKIYECTAPDGDTVYQDDPCTEAPPPKPVVVEKAKTKKPPKVVAKTAPKAAPKTPPPPAAVTPIRFVVPKVAPPKFPSHELPVSTRAIDVRWESPDKTLKTFVAAVAAGDRTAIVSCLADSALADWGPDPESLPLDQLRTTVGSFTGYVAEGDLGPYWSIRALRAGMRPKWIFFERNGDGEWKIGAL